MTQPPIEDSPAWLPDPWGAATYRWWDGRAWTATIHPPRDPPPTPGAPTSAPQPGVYARTNAYVAQVASRDTPVALAQREAGAGHAARVALLVAMFGQAVQALASVGGLHNTLRVVDRLLSAKDGNAPSTTTNPVVSLFSNLGSIAVVVCGVLFIIWGYRAAKTARAVGLHGQWGPGWFIGAWFIPIANLVIPYLCVKSLLPHGHPGVRTIQRWWAFYVAQYLLSTAAIAVGWALYENDTALGVWPWIPGLLSVGCVVGAALYGRQMISTIGAMHQEGVTGTATGGAVAV